MSKEIIVNVGERETRIAVVEEGKLVELHIERSERVVGGLYKCRVANVLPGMDAAFVDINLERNAFLFVGDVIPQNDDDSTNDSASFNTPLESGSSRGRRDGRDRDRVAHRARRSPENGAAPQMASPLEIAAETEMRDDPPTSAEDETAMSASANEEGTGEEPIEGAEGLLSDALLGIAIEADSETDPETADEEDDEDAEEESEAGDDYLEEDEDSTETTSSLGEPLNGAARRNPTRGRNLRRSVLRQQRIKDVLKVGQELLVQVIKGPRSTKGARVSTRISLPGRYLVLMPDADNLGVSRKIEDAKERDRLKKIGDRIRVPGFGLIIRTEAEEKSEQELAQDMDFLIQNWRQVQEKYRSVPAPALIQQDLTLLYKTIRDVFGSDVQKLIVDDPAEYEKANELLERISPKLKGRIHLYDGPQPIFDNFGLETEIERLLRRKVFLKSGGSLVIDETEALTVIDVNTSKNVGGSSLAETIVKTNVDAASEIARQLRLRDIGGIIVIDFIDMNNARDKQSVIKSLETALKKDRSRTKISNISPLGLVEMTRKRTGETLAGFMTEECPYCKGRGHLASAESVSLLLERDLRRQGNDPKNAKKEAFLVKCHPEVAELLIGPEGATIEEMERQLQRALYVRADADAHIEKYSIEPGEIAELDKARQNYRRAQVVECRITRSLLKEPTKCIGWADGYMLDLDDGNRMIGQRAKVRILDVRRSYASGQVVPGTNHPDQP